MILLLVFIAGCSSNKQASRKPDEQLDQSDVKNYDSKRSLGVDFFASGNEPFWVVDMNSEDSTKIYILSNNYTFYYKTPVPFLDSVTKTIKYTFDAEATLTLKKDKCSDNTSGERSDFAASLNVLNKTYLGCGKYIIAFNNPLLNRETLRLNDIWALKKFRNQIVNPKSFKEGVPVIELHLNDGRFLGITNCNTIMGSIDVGNSYIIFSDFTLTKKLCEGDFEQKYLQDLKSVDSWSLDNMQLTLKRNDKEILVYNKID